MNPRGHEAVRRRARCPTTRAIVDRRDVHAQAREGGREAVLGDQQRRRALLLRVGQRQRPRVGDLVPHRSRGRALPRRRPPAADADGPHPRGRTYGGSPHLRTPAASAARRSRAGRLDPMRIAATMQPRCRPLLARPARGRRRPAVGRLQEGRAGLPHHRHRALRHRHPCARLRQPRSSTSTASTGSRPRRLRRDPPEGRRQPDGAVFVGIARTPTSRATCAAPRTRW